MVYSMENPSINGWWWGFPLFQETSKSGTVPKCSLTDTCWWNTMDLARFMVAVALKNSPSGWNIFVQVISDERSGYDAATDPASLFTRYVNICPRQKSRTIRHWVWIGIEGDEVRMIQWCISGTYDIVWWYNETPFLHIFTYNQWFMRDLYLPGWRFEPPDSQVAIQIRILGARVLRNWGSFVHHSCDIEPVATWHLNSKKCNQPKPL